MDCGHSILDLDADVSEQAGWVLVRSLSFDGVTPATSMSLTDSVTGGSYTATLSTATGWAAVSGGIQYTPAGVGCDLDVDLDTLLGSTWQRGGVLCCWDVTIASLTGPSVAVPALVGSTDVYTVFGPTSWLTYVGGASSATGAATATAQRVLAMEPGAVGGVFYRAETASAEPVAFTEMSQASYARNSATATPTGIKWRLGLAESGGTLDVTVSALRVYARYGL